VRSLEGFVDNALREVAFAEVGSGHLDIVLVFLEHGDVNFVVSEAEVKERFKRLASSRILDEFNLVVVDGARVGFLDFERLEEV